MEQTVFRHWKIRLSNRSMQGIPRNSRAFCSAVSLNDEVRAEAPRYIINPSVYTNDRVARRLRIHFKNYNAYSPSERHSEEQKNSHDLPQFP